MKTGKTGLEIPAGGAQLNGGYARVAERQTRQT
jgi:hypothetical protein